ncbi:MAG TPA: DMT family transporter [Ferruginibacter sp.]|nr:DMT family transporter [Ferruginibacter sp.]
MNPKIINWLIFSALSFIWGSSFILIKEGLINLSAFQVASIRMVSSGIILFPIAIKSIRHIPLSKLFIVFLSGVMGSLLPSYLFCLAETGIGSALAGTLNSLTPIFVIIIGALFFQSKTSALKITGILVAFAGSILLYISQPGYAENHNFQYVLYIIVATVFYGINVNMVHRHLQDIPSLQIAGVALFLNAIPAFIVLYFTGYFHLELDSPGILVSTAYSCVLGIFGTAIASIIFYMLIKRAGAVFSSMVTYGIPLVAIMWGILFGEAIGWAHIISLLFILAGVYIANSAKSNKGVRE